MRRGLPAGLAPTTSTTVQLALGDALAMALLERRGFTPADFHRFHPGGKLGAQLLTVAEVMQGGDALPLVRADADMGQAIITMTSHSLGCAVVVDAAGDVVGIVTDGDLRRHMHPGIMAETVAWVMTPNPLHTAPEQIASAALAEMNARKINVLVVQEGRRPVGVLHVQQVLGGGGVGPAAYSAKSSGAGTSVQSRRSLARKSGSRLAMAPATGSAPANRVPAVSRLSGGQFHPGVAPGGDILRHAAAAEHHPGDDAVLDRRLAPWPSAGTMACAASPRNSTRPAAAVRCSGASCSRAQWIAPIPAASRSTIQATAGQVAPAGGV